MAPTLATVVAAMQRDLRIAVADALTQCHALTGVTPSHIRVELVPVITLGEAVLRYEVARIGVEFTL